MWSSHNRSFKCIKSSCYMIMPTGKVATKHSSTSTRIEEENGRERDFNMLVVSHVSTLISLAFSIQFHHILLQFLVWKNCSIIQLIVHSWQHLVIHFIQQVSRAMSGATRVFLFNIVSHLVEMFAVMNSLTKERRKNAMGLGTAYIFFFL